MSVIKDTLPSVDREIAATAVNVLIVGCGHLGSALLQGWSDSDVNCQVVSSRAERICAQYPGATFYKNFDRNDGGEIDIVVFAVPPQSLPAVVQQYSHLADDEVIFVSLAAGISLATLAKSLPTASSIARVMPNLSANIAESTTVGVFNQQTTPSHRRKVEQLFTKVGKFFTIEQENQLDTITPLIGSGPAFLFLLCEALEASSVALGLNAELASEMIRSMLLGSAKYLAQKQGTKAAQLREAVTSKAGVTDAIMDVLRPQFEKLVYQSLHRGQQRSREINHETGN